MACSITTRPGPVQSAMTCSAHAARAAVKRRGALCAAWRGEAWLLQARDCTMHLCIKSINNRPKASRWRPPKIHFSYVSLLRVFPSVRVLVAVTAPSPAFTIQARCGVWFHHDHHFQFQESCVDCHQFVQVECPTQRTVLKS